MIKIMADSTCDLSDEFLEMHDISLASLTIDIEGKIYRVEIIGKERGLNRVLKHYVQEFVNRCNRDITEFVIIGYTSDISIAEELKAKMEQDTDFTGDIHIMQMGVSVGTHVGLGAISMFFVEKR